MLPRVLMFLGIKDRGTSEVAHNVSMAFILLFWGLQSFAHET